MIAEAGKPISADRKGDWFQTYTSVMFWPLDPRANEVRIEDIAHHLSLLCRFNGAVRRFYSVAQHSVLVSEAIVHEQARWGLLHDAAEAYVGDMVRPLKLSMPDYRAAEERVMRAVAERFGLTWPEPPAVKVADNALLMTERRDLMAPPPAPWTPRATPLAATIQAWSPIEAEARFLSRFHTLFGGGW